MKTQSIERLMLETGLRRALERDEFLLHYQAKRDLATGDISGVEALLRWQHPDLGVVPPLQFIPTAEESGLIVPIGKWVLDTACAQNVAWQQQGLPPMRIAVNLSPRQFTDPNLLAGHSRRFGRVRNDAAAARARDHREHGDAESRGGEAGSSPRSRRSACTSRSTISVPAIRRCR